MTEELSNIHPGEVLLEEFLIPMEISQNRLANDIGVPPRRINEIVLGKRSITADTALRLAQYFGTSEKFWTGLQADYDLEEAKRVIGDKLAQIAPAVTLPKLSLVMPRVPAPGARHAVHVRAAHALRATKRTEAVRGSTLTQRAASGKIVTKSDKSSKSPASKAVVKSKAKKK